MMKNLERMYNLNFGEILPLYVQKVERKQRTAAELMEVLTWLTGYSEAQLKEFAESATTMEQVVRIAPQMTDTVPLIKGVICGYRVEEMDDLVAQRIRAMDKVVDELAKGKTIEKICRT